MAPCSYYPVGMSTPPAVSSRLRQIRLQQNLTLKQVEIKSRGKWKAVVVGSYERGARSLSVEKAAQLCDFYGVPLHQLFSEKLTDSRLTEHLPIEAQNESWRIDLRQLRTIQGSPDEFTRVTYLLLQQISIKRDDWNGEIMTIRKSDQEILGLITQKTISDIRQALTFRGLLIKH